MSTQVRCEERIDAAYQLLHALILLRTPLLSRERSTEIRLLEQARLQVLSQMGAEAEK